MRVYRMKRIAALPIAVVLLLHVSVAMAQVPAHSAVIEKLRTRLQTDLATDDVGGVTAAVVVGDSIVWTESFGWADRDKRTQGGRSTLYRIGSITKTFTGVVLAQLVDRKVIALDDPVERYLPEIRQIPNAPPGAAPITFRQLASHTAGLSRSPNVPDAGNGPIEQWESKLLAAIPAATFIARPGERYSYSNIGYAILGLALSRAAHVPYTTLVQDGIFTPLGLSSTAFGVTDAMRGSLSVGYVLGSGGMLNTATAEASHQGIGYALPAGSIYSTVTDLARFMASLSGARTPVLSDSMRRMMMTKQTPEPGPNGYGLALEVAAPSGGVKTVGHGGVITGYFSALVFDPESKIGVILLRNFDGTTPLMPTAHQVVRELVAESRGVRDTAYTLIAGVPDTPAGRMLSGWINARNSGDSTVMQQFYLRSLGREQSKATIDRELALGGYDVLKVLETADDRIVVQARERNTKLFFTITVAVMRDQPERISMVGLVVALPPDSLAPRKLTSSEINDAVASAPFRQLSAWNDVFNSADRDRMQQYIDSSWPTGNVAGQLSLREQTGGVDVLSVEQATSTTVVGTLKERATGTFSRVVVTVEAAEPHRILRLILLKAP
jgi:CubicO group peptidase (beta-lactamase class C family)